MVLEIIGLEICVPDLIWTVIDFFILFFLLKKFLFKPLVRFIDARNDKISAGLAQGFKAQAEMDAAEAESSEQISESTLKAKNIVETARKNGEIQKEAGAFEAREEARRNEESRRRSLDEEKEDLRRKVNENIPEYVAMLTSRLLKEDKN